MSVIEQLIRSEDSGAISFGNYKLEAKAKVEDYCHMGDLYKVKTYKTMTKLERNGLFVYESVPGTGVNDYVETSDGVSFLVEGEDSAQLTIGLQEDTEYEVIIGNKNMGTMTTNMSGKLSINVEMPESRQVKVRIRKI